MPSSADLKHQIENALKSFSTKPLYDAGLGLLDTLGYRSVLTLKLKGINDFQETMDQRGRLNEKAAKAVWEQTSVLIFVTIQFKSKASPAETQRRREIIKQENVSLLSFALKKASSPLPSRRLRVSARKCS